MFIRYSTISSYSVVLCLLQPESEPSLIVSISCSFNTWKMCIAERLERAKNLSYKIVIAGLFPWARLQGLEGSGTTCQHLIWTYKRVSILLMRHAVPIFWKTRSSGTTDNSHFSPFTFIIILNVVSSGDILTIVSPESGESRSISIRSPLTTFEITGGHGFSS